jgi:hypothetical protein
VVASGFGASLLQSQGFALGCDIPALQGQVNLKLHSGLRPFAAQGSTLGYHIPALQGQVNLKLHSALRPFAAQGSTLGYHIPALQASSQTPTGPQTLARAQPWEPEEQAP